jgi:hypothetical protein
MGLNVLRIPSSKASAKIDYSYKHPKHFHEKLGDMPYFNIFKRSYLLIRKQVEAINPALFQNHCFDKFKTFGIIFLVVIRPFDSMS